MSDKITFQDLVEIIAEQADQSQQFTHDFIKDLVAVINEGLEADGKVNIAGFGKFELKKVSEREGYNPQTGEKITIPEHNKIEFKPYKALRERVNAPYADLEPELLGAKGDKEESAEEETGPEDVQDEAGTPSGEPSEPEEEKEEPLAAPPFMDESEEADEKESSRKAPWEEEMESEPEIVDEDDPFGIDAKYRARLGKEEDQEEEEEGEGEVEPNDDIVEFSPEIVPPEEPDEAEEAEEEEEDLFESLPEESEEEPETEVPADHEVVDEEDLTEEETEEDQPPAGRYDPSLFGMDKWKEKEKDKKATPAAKESTKPAGETPAPEKREEERKAAPKKPQFKSRLPQRKGTGASIWIIAAAFIILLIAIGAWYFLAADQQMQTQQPPSAVSEQQSTTPDQQQEEAAGPAQDQEQAEAADEDAAAQAPPSQSQAASDQSAAQTMPDEVVTVNVNKGETLWGLADDNYENPYLWPWIYHANQPDIVNPNLIYAGQSLDIPVRRGNNNTLSQNDSLQVAIGYVETYDWYRENGFENAKFYLYAAKTYHKDVLRYTDIEVDESDLAFANQAR